MLVKSRLEFYHETQINRCEELHVEPKQKEILSEEIKILKNPSVTERYNGL